MDGQSTPVKVTLSERTVCSSVIESTVFLLLLNILMVESGHQVNSTLLVLCVLELRVRDTRVCVTNWSAYYREEYLQASQVNFCRLGLLELHELLQSVP